MLLLCVCVIKWTCQQLHVAMRHQQRCLLSCSTSSVIFLLGFVLGCAFFVLTRFAVIPCFWSLDHSVPSDGWQNEHADLTSASTTDENLVLVGVMSAKQFLESRIIPIFDTWAVTVPGKVSICVIFTRESSYCFQCVLAIAILSDRPSICPSVCSSVTRVDQSKTEQARITKSSPSADGKTLVLERVKLFHKFEGITPNEGAEWKGVGKICDFWPISSCMSVTVWDRAKVIINH